MYGLLSSESLDVLKAAVSLSFSFYSQEQIYVLGGSYGLKPMQLSRLGCKIVSRA